MDDTLDRLNHIAKKSIKDVYLGSGEFKNITNLCNDLKGALTWGIEFCSNELKSESFSTFAKESLGILTEVLIRRCTPR